MGYNFFVTVAVYNSIDIFIYSIIILLVILFHGLVNYENLQLSARYRLLLALCILVILVLDLFTRIPLPFDKKTVYYLRYWLNFVYFVLQPLPVSLGLMFLFSLFSEKRYSLKYLLFFLTPFFAGCIVMAYSYFTGFAFYIDADNVYHRGPGTIFFALTNYSYIIPSVWFILHNRDKVKRQTLLIIISYTVIPAAGSFFQLCFYGIVTAWPSFVLALLIIFIFVEGRRSDRDYLTGLLNRQSFDARIHGRIGQYSRKGAFAFIIIDLNKFKSINDTYGHAAGDNVLQAVAVILSHSISLTDIAARYGGDEFVLLIESTDKQTVKKIIARIERNLAVWNFKSDNPFSITLSAGYAVFNPEKHKDYESLFKESDTMMFKIKEKNR